MHDDILFSREGHLGLVTLNRSSALNALTLSMIRDFYEQLLVWEQDDAIHAVVVCATSGKAFCAGGDVRWLYEAGLRDDPQQMQFFWHEYHLNQKIHDFKKPYIALMDGITMGGGVGISLHGSHAVASERFGFAMPETGIGFFPDVGASHLLSRCPASFGMYLGLTGNRLNAADAHALNLVKYLIPSEQHPFLLASLIDEDLSQDAHVRVDKCLQRFIQSMPPSSLMQQGPTVQRCFSLSTVPQILSALVREEDIWCHEVHATLKQKSPLSLSVTCLQLQRAQNMKLAECLHMDYNLAMHFMQDHDFYEGVRALLVDKDKSPQWQPADLSLIDPDHVLRYFEASLLSLDLLV